MRKQPPIMAAAHKMSSFSGRWRHSRPRFSGSPARRSHPRGHDGGRAARRGVLIPRARPCVPACAPVISPSTLPLLTPHGVSFWRLCDARARCGEISRRNPADMPAILSASVLYRTLKRSRLQIFLRAQPRKMPRRPKQGTLARRLTGASGQPVE